MAVLMSDNITGDDCDNHIVTSNLGEPTTATLTVVADQIHNKVIAVSNIVKEGQSNLDESTIASMTVDVGANIDIETSVSESTTTTVTKKRTFEEKKICLRKEEQTSSV